MRPLIQQILLILLLANSSCLLAQETVSPGTVSPEDKKPAQIKVKGAGPLKNFVLQQQIRAIFNEPRSYFESTEIEDAALIILSYSNNEGYLESTTRADITRTNGETIQLEWDKNMDVSLSRDLRATRVVFNLNRGPKFYYASLDVNKISSLPYQGVEEFFYAEPYFFQKDRSKTFTPYLFNSGARNLRVHLNNQGYRKASVVHELIEQDNETGAVHTKVTIQEGPLHLLKAVRIRNQAGEEVTWDLSAFLNKPYSDFLRQDIIQELRNAYYEKGYIYIDFNHTITIEEISPARADVLLTINFVEGNQIRISGIEFEGNVNVKTRLLEGELEFEPGDFLNPAKLDETRLNISRLGLFQKIDFHLEDQSDTESKLVFDLVERSGWQVDTMGGWGSYERLRLGIVAEQLNTFGRGHRLQLKSIISQKSLQAETRYLIPDLFKTSYPLTTKLFFLEREELSFDREELGIDLRTFKYLKFLDADMDLRYTYQRLQARDNQLSNLSTTDNDVRAGSIEARFSRNTRDNPINPTSGYRLYGNFEWAAMPLGGQVDYQLAELGLAHSAEIYRGLIWHGSLSHGVVGSFKYKQSQIPTNKLFFPGGENSIRGYQRGQAAPHDAQGVFFGATSYTLLNLELEQKLSGNLSLVGFVDTLGTSSKITQYPFDEYLYSAGLGVRLKTFMGPIRLEYGRNINPRPLDPKGTLHFSLGYPF